jgi:phosphatidylglycerophosphatase A
LTRLPLAAVGGTCLAVFVIGWWAAGRLARHLGIEDPSVVVIDEVLGMFVSLLGLPFDPVVAVVGFVLFRIFDIVKPYPARALEHLPGGLGIMADDVAAGVYANLVLRIGFLVWPPA